MGLFVPLDYYTNMYCTSECKLGRLSSPSDFKEGVIHSHVMDALLQDGSQNAEKMFAVLQVTTTRLLFSKMLYFGCSKTETIKRTSLNLIQITHTSPSFSNHMGSSAINLTSGNVRLC